MDRKVLFLVAIIFFLVSGGSPIQAQSLPTVEVWVSVRAADTQEVLAAAEVENTLCAGLPAETCTAVGAYDPNRQAFVMVVPRLEAYEFVIRAAGYQSTVRQGTGLEPVSVLVVFLQPQAGSGQTYRVFLPLVLQPNSVVIPPYDPQAALNRLNAWRRLAGVPVVQGNAELHAGCRAHARYTAQNALLGHVEDPQLPNYTAEGDFCGQAGVVSLGAEVYPSDEQMVDAMLVSPFHALYALDPRLVEVGFGSYRHADIWGGVFSAAALDVFHGLDSGRSVTPWVFPGWGKTVEYLTYDGRGIPDPLTSCPGYTAPSGTVLMAAFGEGEVEVEWSTLNRGSEVLEHCVLTAATYTHPNPEVQMEGRTALWAQGAVLLVPRQPLQAGNWYAFTVRLKDGREAHGLFQTAQTPKQAVTMQVR